MSVDFYPCAECEECFADCGDFFRCDCGEHFCSTECGGYHSEEIEKEDGMTEVITCKMCRKESATSNQLLQFLMDKYSLTYDQVWEMYTKQ